ncbi:trypsin-like peptidase domain-containing protein [Dokdonia donghaensis]|uniref:Serine protease n=1 Tax=Dokdonia donghaensis DSW-1 TaxID=1300343 RepID=A0A0A2GSD7_9FLAO|nr:trypsin-like peptidase domain-containing protein [Dokdonia donghaensis]ANH61422.1 Periplasmic serine endoprotease DegP precursor [Dokdonia donghaensis DSW-1]KGO05398.1 serine protease [Dokdonia donghaensis DSW-1]
MKKIGGTFLIALLAGAITLGSYKLFIEEPTQVVSTPVQTQTTPAYTPVNYEALAAAASGVDFTEAAERTVNGVVHVKNVQVYKQPRNMMEYLRGGGQTNKGIVGAGSGVIISGDGYIITNNHVIDGASEVEVTLNNNKTFMAEVIGKDAKADIAILKIDAGEELPYIPFGDSDATKVGEWVLAVGNPFNLTSTVTAGIVSAKARDIDERDANFQSFIQTDAAINPGNSGGALVNIFGELVGINTAITSQTGSYVGYAFAVPSNNARKIMEDIMQYGSVQKGILGVTGGTLNAAIAEDQDLSTTEGFYVASVEYESGAEQAGITTGDIIKKLDNVNITKFSDLSGYINTKRPNDIIQVEILRDDELITLPVKLVKSVTFDIERLGIQVKNASPKDLNKYKAKNGVVISQTLTEAMKRYRIEGLVISEIDDVMVNSIDDVKEIFKNKSANEPVSIVFVDQKGERNRFIFD